MRASTLVTAAVSAVLLAAAPALAQTVTMSANITNAAGPVNTCPVVINFVAKISASGWSSTANREIQYKWIRSDGADAPTQTLTFPANTDTQTVTTTWTLSAPGTNWEAIQISYPPIANTTSEHAVFTLTCPTPGSLTVGRGEMFHPVIRPQ